jgi:hypothetical protein
VINGVAALLGKDSGGDEVVKRMTSGGALSLHLSDGRRWESVSTNGGPTKGTFQLISRSPNGLVKDK